jgi:hypothetical protein
MDVGRSLGVVKTGSRWENMATHGIMVTHWIMPHGTTSN